MTLYICKGNPTTWWKSRPRRKFRAQMHGDVHSSQAAHTYVSPSGVVKVWSWLGTQGQAGRTGWAGMLEPDTSDFEDWRSGPGDFELGRWLRVVLNFFIVANEYSEKPVLRSPHVMKKGNEYEERIARSGARLLFVGGSM